MVLKSLGCDYFELKAFLQSQFGSRLKACSKFYFFIFLSGLQGQNIGGTLPILCFADDRKSKSFPTFPKNMEIVMNMENERSNSYVYI